MRILQKLVAEVTFVDSFFFFNSIKVLIFMHQTDFQKF
jgi:hypothetical protein